jgi:hypothetical protein
MTRFWDFFSRLPMRIFLLRARSLLHTSMFARHTPSGFVPKKPSVSIGQVPVMGKEDPYHNLLEYKGASLVAHIFILLCVTASVVAVAEPSL